VNLASQVKHLNSEVADAKLEISDEKHKKAVEGREGREREENCEDHRSVQKL
jgi:hypothetical protein